MRGKHRSWILALLLVSALVLTAFGLLPRTVPLVRTPCADLAADQGGGTYFCVDSDPDERIGAGQLLLLTPAEGEFTVHPDLDGSIEVDVVQADNWRARFSPPAGHTLANGIYEVPEPPPYKPGIPQPPPNSVPAIPQIHVRAFSRGCAEYGWFEVLELVYDPTSHAVERLAVNFEQRCGAGPGAMRGMIRYNSTVGAVSARIATRDPRYPLTATPSYAPPQTSTACTSDARLRNQDTFICLQSTPGDILGHGQSWVVLPSETQPWARQGEGRIVAITVQEAPGIWLTFAAPEEKPLKPGIYDHPVRAEPDPRVPRLEVSLGSYTCNDEAEGRFAILEFAYGAENRVDHFAANFEYHCRPGDPPLLGMVRYHATVPLAATAPLTAGPVGSTPTVAPPALSPACTDRPGLQGRETMLCASIEGGTLPAGGTQRVITQEDVPFTAALYSDPDHAQRVVEVTVPDAYGWVLAFAAPAGQRLAPGVYDQTVDALRRPGGPPGLTVMAEEKTCALDGRFEVLEYVTDAGNENIVRFAANFEARCAAGGAILRGSIRYQAPAGTARPPPAQPPPSTGTPAPVPISPACGSIAASADNKTFLCLVGAPGASFLDGTSLLLTPGTNEFRVQQDRGIWLSVVVPTADHDAWSVTFNARLNQPLQRGMQTFVYDDGSDRWQHPALQVTHGTRVCHYEQGRFNILDLAYDAASGTVQRFAADFEHYCNGNPVPLQGSIRYDMTGQR